MSYFVGTCVYRCGKCGIETLHEEYINVVGKRRTYIAKCTRCGKTVMVVIE